LPAIPRRFALLAPLALAACAMHPAAPDAVKTAAGGIDWAQAQSLTVKMMDFAYTPAHLDLKAGQPVKLTLVNDGSDLHDFSSPAFFAAASYRQGSTVPAGGKIAVAKGQSAEIDLVPGATGQYPLECTEFLHTLFGMTGTIAVSAAN
jgi:plastocyanin